MNSSNFTAELWSEEILAAYKGFPASPVRRKRKMPQMKQFVPDVHPYMDIFGHLLGTSMIVAPIAWIAWQFWSF